MGHLDKLVNAEAIPTICAKNYQPNGNLYVRLEGEGLLGNIKARSAYFMVRAIYEESGGSPPRLVESSSGNLALGLNYFAPKFNTDFLCLIDGTLPLKKQENLTKHGVKFRIVDRGDHPDFRTARIAEARRMGSLDGWFWTNQYANKANMDAHFKTTGPAMLKLLNKNKTNWILSSVGSAGTICGITKFFKQYKDLDIRIVGVEPLGSTSFGGKPGKYLPAGAGMLEPAELLVKYGKEVDYFAQVSDYCAAVECKIFNEKEGKSIGLTSGHVLAMAKIIATNHPNDDVIVISPDGGDLYSNEMTSLLASDDVYIVPEMKIYNLSGR